MLVLMGRTGDHADTRAGARADADADADAQARDGAHAHLCCDAHVDDLPAADDARGAITHATADDAHAD